MNCDVLCLSETWLNPAIQGIVIQADSFLFTYLTEQKSGRSKGGMMCFVVNEDCYPIFCSPDLNLLPIFLHQSLSHMTTDEYRSCSVTSLQRLELPATFEKDMPDPCGQLDEVKLNEQTMTHATSVKKRSGNSQPDRRPP